MTDVEDLRAALRAQKVILFVGAGVSATLGLPDWRGLMAHVGNKLGYNKDVFLSLAGNPTLAEYYLLRGGKRKDVAKFLTPTSSAPISSSDIHAAIVKLNFPMIYTTNYDDCIEKAFVAAGVQHTRIIDGSDMAAINRGVTQIVKFHGDLSRPETLVFTESDYFERLTFESEMDIKLRSDMLEYDVLFVGYSLTDVNLRNILYRLSRFRKKYAKKHARNSYIFLDRKNNVQIKIFEEWGVKTIL
jgi:NAD-dependent SIR2 family protein deacetylase